MEAKTPIKRKEQIEILTLLSDIPTNNGNLDKQTTGTKIYVEQVSDVIRNPHKLQLLQKEESRKPTPRKLVECPYCKKKKASNNIDAHIAVHVKKVSGIKKHVCPQCQYSTNRISHLQSHVGIKHNVKHQLAKLEKLKNRRKRRAETKTVVKDEANGESCADIIASERESGNNASTQTDSQSMSTESCNSACIVSKTEYWNNASTTTDIIVSQTDASAGNIEEIRALQDIQSRISLLQSVLSVHYSLLVNASTEQKMVHASIFEAMTEPIRCIFELIVENLKNESNQYGAFITTWKDLHGMVEQLTEMHNELQEQHAVFIEE